MSFEDFLVGFKSRHADWFGERPGVNQTVNHSPNRLVNDQTLPMPKVVEKTEHTPVPVRLDDVQDRMSKAAGDDLDDWDGWEPESTSEVLE